MDVWIVSTKNTVSNNQPHHLYTVKQKQLRFGVVFLFLLFFQALIFLAYNSPNSYFYFYFRNKSSIKQKKPVTQAQILDMTGFL